MKSTFSTASFIDKGIAVLFISWEVNPKWINSLYSDEKLGNTIGTVVNHYNNSSKEFKKIDKDILKVSSGNSKLEYDSSELDKPLLDDWLLQN